MIIDAHSRIGANRDSAATAQTLLHAMDAVGVDRALIAPREADIAFNNRAGNEATARAARESGGRLIPYAVATPWRADAVDVLRRAKDGGARALAVDSALQGFDLLDGLVEPLLEFAAESGWFVYVRTGTPPTHLPMPTALLARRHPELNFIMGRSGATDFWIDAAPALRHARNLWGDTSYAPWDTVLTEFRRDPEIGTSRLTFSLDLPYSTARGEVKRILDWPIAENERAAVMGGNLLTLLGD